MSKFSGSSIEEKVSIVDAIITAHNEAVKLNNAVSMAKARGEIRDALEALNVEEVQTAYDGFLNAENPVFALVTEGSVSVTGVKNERGSANLIKTEKLHVIDVLDFNSYVKTHSLEVSFVAENWANMLSALSRLLVLFHAKDAIAGKRLANFLKVSSADANALDVSEVPSGESEFLPIVQNVTNGIVDGAIITVAHVRRLMFNMCRWSRKDMLVTQVAVEAKFRDGFMRILHSALTGKEMTFDA